MKVTVTFDTQYQAISLPGLDILWEYKMIILQFIFLRWQMSIRFNLIEKEDKEGSV